MPSSCWEAVSGVKSLITGPKAVENTDGGPGGELANDLDIKPATAVGTLIRSPSAKSFGKKYVVEDVALGAGMSGSVMKGKVRDTGLDVALKNLPTGQLTDLQRENTLSEINNQLNMDHPNICRILEVYVEPQRFVLVIERLHGPNLLDHLNRKGYTEKDAGDAVSQMLKAVAYCHSKDVVHRDLKLENFCLEDKSANARIKMIDFGLSITHQTGVPLTHACGSLLYVAPEVLKRSYTEKADMWSMGVITFALLWGQPPFNGRDDRELCQAIRTCDYKFPERPNVSNTAKLFIKDLLRIDPKKRLSAKDALQHTWIKKCLQDEDHPTLDCSVLEGMKELTHRNALKQRLLCTLAPKATAAEVSRWANQFAMYDEEGTGMVSVKDMTRRLVEVSELSDEEAKEIAGALGALSDDGEMVSYSAFLTACLSSHMASLSDSDLRGLFRSLDTDGDDKVKKEDFQKALGDSISQADLDELIGDRTYLKFSDVRWLLLGPRFSGVYSQQLEKLFDLNDVAHVWKTKRAPRDHTDSAELEAARVENYAWRKMGMKASESADTQHAVDASSQSLPSVAPASEQVCPIMDVQKEQLTDEERSKKLVESLEKKENTADTWAAATMAAKGDDVEQARRENMAWRMMHKDPVPTQPE